MTQEAHPMLCDHLEKWDGVRGGQIQEREVICILMADSHHCTTHFKEIILQLKINLKNNIYICQILMLYTLNILQFYLPILSIFCLLVTIHDIS